MLPELLTERLAHPDNRRIAFVGVAKNVGKTTTFNAVLRTLSDANAPTKNTVGLASIGIDGESHDVLLGTPKPKIHVGVDDWVITAQHAASSSTAALEYVESLNFETPLGEVFLARVRAPGNIILGGLRHREDLLLGLELFERHGITRTLIDGAYGRVTTAGADLSDAVIVATGAIVGSTVAKIAHATNTLVHRLTLPVATDPHHVAAIHEAVTRRCALLTGPDLPAPRDLPCASALLALSKSRQMWTCEIDAIAIPGLVSDRVAEELLSVPAASQPRTLLVPDGTVFHHHTRLWRKLLERWDVRTLRSCNVLGISINPTSLQGHHVDERELGEALEARWPEMVVFNPCGEG